MINQSINLIRQLKQKRFNYESNYSQENDSTKSVKNHTFECGYHPNERITNVCLASQIPKPLCSKCLSKHIQEHQTQNKHCVMEDFSGQMNKLKLQLNSKISKCQSIDLNNQQYRQFKVSNHQKARNQLQSYKNQIHKTIDDFFVKFQSQTDAKFNSNLKQLDLKLKSAKQKINFITQSSSRGLNQLVSQNQNMNTIFLLSNEIKKQFQKLQSIQNQIFTESLSKMILSLNNQDQIYSILIQSVENTLEIKQINISNFELQKSLRLIKQLKIKQNVQTTNSQEKNENLLRLQMLFKNHSQNKLLNIQKSINSTSIIKNCSNGFSVKTDTSVQPQAIQIHTQHDGQLCNVQNTKQRIMIRLNDTTNKLKSSLSEIKIAQGAKVKRTFDNYKIRM